MREIDILAITEEMCSTNLFVTREFGQILTPRFEEILKNSTEKVFVFNFSDVLYVDFSCPNEVFGSLIPKLKNDADMFIFLKGLNESKRENIDIALSEDKLTMLEIEQDEIQIRGHLPEYLSEILERIIHNEEKLTARQIADETGTKISTASSKLLTLWKQGLLDREEEVTEEGKKYIYTSVLPLIK
ncbi:hypothetical protein BTO30_11700 [Domibacillus antri]|uniref:HTH iclR-type domain-containing protein n=1 Tax=Domibacillus antri TaxID=1714264 RepID=A0A1Q8Q3Z3_9BACI|nr:MarR family transcriptional regulator [Domibacillus antri]OLN21991.1 hypothetical protein BTO30_11700 [Domibacillus antri]